MALPILFFGAVGWHVASWVSLSLGFLNPLFNDATRRLGQGSDFFAVYHAGTSFLGNQSLYELEGRFPPFPFAYEFRYVPSMAYMVGAPLNLLSPWQAYWAWLAFNEMLLIANSVLTWRYARDQPLRWLGCAMWLSFTPVYLEFYLGQFSFLMATLFFWMGLGLAARNRLLTGAAWATSLVVKTNSLLFIPIFLRMRSLTVVIAGLAFAVALNAPYFIMKPAGFNSWTDNFSGLLAGGTIDFHAGALGLRNLLAAIGWLADARPGPVLDVVGPVAELPVWAPTVACVSLLATFIQRRFDPIIALAIWVSAYFLIYPDVWEHQYVMLLPILVLLLILRPQYAPLTLVVYAITALPTPYWLLEELEGNPLEMRNPLGSDAQQAWTAWEIVLYHLAKVGPTLLLWSTLVHASLRSLDWRLMAQPRGSRRRRAAGG